MAILSEGMGRARALALIVAALMLLVLGGIAGAQQSPAPVALADSERLALDQIEATLKRERLSTAELIELGRVAVPIRDRLRDRVAQLEPQRAQAETRLKQLGPPPAAGAPPEPEALAAERARLTAEFVALDAALKQTRLLALRADQLIQRGTEQRYVAYTRELFVRSWSVLDPEFWLLAIGAMGSDLRQGTDLVTAWAQFVRDREPSRIAGAVVTLLALVLAGLLALRAWQRRTAIAPADTPRARVWPSAWAFVRAAVTMPLIVFAALEVLEAFALIPAALQEITTGLAVAVVIAALGRGVAVGVLAAYEPQRRLAPYDDRTARSLHRHLVTASRIMALAVFAEVAHRQTSAPQVLVVLTSMLFALAMLGVLLHLLFQLRASAAAFDDDRPRGNLWIRGIAWIVAAAIAVAIVTGHARLAEFVAERVLVAIVIFGLFYLLAKLSDTLFSEVLTAETPRGRAIVANLGLYPRRVALLGVLMSGAVRVILAVLALAFVLGPWEGSTTDLMATMQGLTFGLTIGEATISFPAIVGALAVLVIGIVITRVVQGWLERRLLPRTELEPSLQLSVGMIFGYVGIIAAIALALGALGIDLQKIALVAGALSVGIGFGLQSIVSNFVSGLILLTERPIRVGDWIVVKEEEGFVRRIRVRATEVETFDRASVIIPNSDLITGVVKNWTHGNILGRVAVKVGVNYDSDPEQVRELLLAVAAAHPAVLPEPPPSVLLMGFGDNALEFELRCIVRDIQQRLNVRSDLNFAVLARFREAGIDIPFPQRTVHLAGGEIPPRTGADGRP